jgi:ABC-type nitrate/sulfonate/bicarbonate transport system substrate-binding protein
MVLEPFMSRIENQQTAVRWKGNSELHSAQQVAVIIYGPTVVEEKPEAGRRWMTAYIRGLRDYNDAFGPRKQGREDVVQILIKHTVVKDPRDYEQMRPAGLDPDGQLKLQGIREDLAYYERAGLVREPVDLARVVDTSFQEFAVQRLGPYQR